MEMTQITRPIGTDKVEELTPPVVESAALMNGRRELIIRHGAEAYRLRVTASNKLILTK